MKQFRIKSKEEIKKEFGYDFYGGGQYFNNCLVIPLMGEDCGKIVTVDTYHPYTDAYTLKNHHSNWHYPACFMASANTPKGNRF